MEHLPLGDQSLVSTIQQQSISIVLPAWNEASGIERAISEADTALSRIVDQYEIIVVDDGSKDETAKVVSKIAAKNSSVRLVRHETNIGYGAALRSGFESATCDLVVFTDADNQFDLTELDRFVLLAEKYQIVCGYRIDRKDTALRCLYSRVYNQLVRCLLRTGVRDIDCALKMFHRDVIKDLKITTDGFLVNSELLTQAKQKNYSVVEVGVSHRPRVEGESTVSVTHIPTVLASLLRYWWNYVQFPGGERTEEMVVKAASARRAQAKRNKWGKALLLAVAVILLFTGLSYPLIDRDETRYAEIPREMIETGNWTLPQLNFRPYYDKPALLYWLCAASYSVFGVSEWSARLVPALCGLGTLLATMYFGSRLFGQRVGLLAALVLLLSAGFLGTSRILLIDGLLTLCATVSLFCAYEAMRRDKLHLGWWTAASVACGVAFMAKGPVAFVLLIPPTLVYGWLTNSSARPRIRHWMMLVGVVVAVAAPWFIVVSLHDPNFAYEFFYKHNVTRFAGAYHARPIWYFLPVLMIAGHPWTFLTIPYLGFLTSHSEESRRRRVRPLGFMLLWSAWCFGFFSISKCKLPPYILPAAPAMSLMIGHYLDQILFSKDKNSLLNFSRNWAPWLSASATCIAGVSFGIFSLAADFEIPVIAWFAIACWTILLVAIVLLSRKLSNAQLGWGVCVATSVMLASFVLHREIPQYAQNQTVFGPGSPLLAELPSDEQAPIVTVDHEWSGIPFYLGRNDITNFESSKSSEMQAFAEEHSSIIFVMRKKQDQEDLLDQLPEQTELSVIAERGPARIVMATTKKAAENVARLPAPDSIHR